MDITFDALSVFGLPPFLRFCLSLGFRFGERVSVQTTGRDREQGRGYRERGKRGRTWGEIGKRKAKRRAGIDK